MSRKKGSHLSDNWRNKIRAGVLMTRMLDHFDGKIELTPTQLRAGEIVLKKIVPDLAKSEHEIKGDITLTELILEATSRRLKKNDDEPS